MVSRNENVSVEVHHLSMGDVDSGLACLVRSDLDALLEANAAYIAENAALREFVGVVDDVLFLMGSCADGDRYHGARRRLADEYGLPLPEVER